MKYSIIILINCFMLIMPVCGQDKKSETDMIDVIKDTLFISKQSKINYVKSRRVIQFNLPFDTYKWGYYFKSIEKHNIDKALSENYFEYFDFIPDTFTNMPGGTKKYHIKSKEVGPVKLEVLLLDKEGAAEYLKEENGICVIQRPNGYFRDESTLCEVGDCHSSNKVVVDSKINNEYYLGFRNINFREDACIILQIVAITK